MTNLLWITLYMGVFVLASSYGLHYAAYRKGLDVADDNKDDDAGMGDVSEEDDGPSTRNPLLNHWLNFGGGYYGTVAFVELMIIELKQLREFMGNWQGLTHFIDSLGMETLIGFFVEQIQNFVAAIIWPTYYLNNFTILQCGIFVFVTYVLFEYAKKLALQQFNKQVRTSKGESYSG